MSGKKSGLKGCGKSNSRAQGSKTFQEQLEEIKQSERLFKDVFGDQENVGVDEDGNIHSVSGFEKRKVKVRSGKWYKDNAETSASVKSSTESGKGYRRKTEKEHDMSEATSENLNAEDMAAKVASESVGTSGPAKDAAEKAFRMGAEWARKTGQAEGVRQGAKEEVKGFMGKMKNWFDSNRTKVGVAMGVAGTVGATAAFKAYKDRQGENSARMGDTTVTWTEGGAGGPGGPAPAGAGGGAAPGGRGR